MKKRFYNTMSTPSSKPCLLSQEKKKKKKSAWQIYFGIEYKKMMKERPGLTFGEYSTEIGSQWKKLDKDAKNAYSDPEPEPEPEPESFVCKEKSTSINKINKTNFVIHPSRQVMDLFHQQEHCKYSSPKILLKIEERIEKKDAVVLPFPSSTKRKKEEKKIPLEEEEEEEEEHIFLVERIDDDEEEADDRGGKHGFSDGKRRSGDTEGEDEEDTVVAKGEEEDEEESSNSDSDSDDDDDDEYDNDDANDDISMGIGEDDVNGL